MTPAPAVAPEPSPSPAIAPEAPAGPGARPGGVTFAGVAAIVYGALGALIGLVMLFGGAAFASVLSMMGAEDGGVFFGLIGAFLGIIGLFIIAASGVGIVAGAQALKGKQWARWTLVALYGVWGLIHLSGAATFFPLALAAVNVVAIIMLLNNDAKTWFEGQPA